MITKLGLSFFCFLATVVASAVSAEASVAVLVVRLALHRQTLRQALTIPQFFQALTASIVLYVRDLTALTPLFFRTVIRHRQDLMRFSILLTHVVAPHSVLSIA